MSKHSKLLPLADRGPMRVMFLITSMPVGGAETLLVNLIRRLDRGHFAPELCCLKSFGRLGQILAEEVPAFENLLQSKHDLRVLPRLTRLMRQRRIDAVVTVGAGDKMFWGRLAAWRAEVPVVLSALHSTGWPDGIGRLNRMLTPITDGFIGVAEAHGEHLVENERFPRSKVHVIPNGVDVERFHPGLDGLSVRKQLGIAADAPVAGIVAALRPEKNHGLLMEAAARVRRIVPNAQFLVVGEGPEQPNIEAQIDQLGLRSAVHMLGNRHDIPQLLAALDAFVLTSRMEANPVSILEAMAVGKPVVAPRVGSIPESVHDGATGYLTDVDNIEQVAQRLITLLQQPTLAKSFGATGRNTVVGRWSLEHMVRGYEQLINAVYTAKCPRAPWQVRRATTSTPEAANLTPANRES